MNRDDLVLAVINAYIVISDYNVPGIYNRDVVTQALDDFAHTARDLHREFTALIDGA